MTTNYTLQVKVPHSRNYGMIYADTDGYWNHVDGGTDLNYLKSQAVIMRRFWKHVRIVQKERVVIEETVVDE